MSAIGGWHTTGFSLVYPPRRAEAEVTDRRGSPPLAGWVIVCAGYPPARAMHVGQSVERHRVADEGVIAVDLRSKRIVTRVEAQLDLLAHELVPYLEIAATPAHGGVFAHDALVAVQEDLCESRQRRRRPKLIELCEKALAWRRSRSLVSSEVVLASEPRKVNRTQVFECDHLAR